MELVEVLPGALYWLSSASASAPAAAPLVGPCRVDYISVGSEFVYRGFARDFGPLHLGQVATFCRRLNEKLRAIGVGVDALDNQADASDARVCVHVPMTPQLRANAVCLLGCWAILCRGWSAERAYAPFQHLRLPCFHDASQQEDGFGLTVLHVLQGLERAVRCGLFRLQDFDETAYLEDMDPQTRDLSWITPRIAAFAGPQSRSHTSGWCLGPTPQEYVDYFVVRQVKVVVRLNRPKYHKTLFENAGIQVVDLFFPDGTCPSERIVEQFLQLCGQHEPKNIAVHCKAGLGRTGTLIACLLIQKYAFSAEQAIGWLRLCRPGSIIGGQQQFLRDLQPHIHAVDSLQQPQDEEESSNQVSSSSLITKGIVRRAPEAKADQRPYPTPVTLLKPPRPPKIPGRLSPTTTTMNKQADFLLMRKHALAVESCPLRPLSPTSLRKTK